VIEFVAVLPGSERIAVVREMFLECQREIGVDLCFQGFEEEVSALPGKYGPPRGSLLLVLDGERPVACGALRDLGGGICELKRIYVRPEARRKGLAREISLRLLEFALANGYLTARLDTMQRLTGAVELYRDLGFDFIEPYNFNPEPDIVYMEKNLMADG